MLYCLGSCKAAKVAVILMLGEYASSVEVIKFSFSWLSRATFVFCTHEIGPDLISFLRLFLFMIITRAFMFFAHTRIEKWYLFTLIHHFEFLSHCLSPNPMLLFPFVLIDTIDMRLMFNYLIRIICLTLMYFKLSFLSF